LTREGAKSSRYRHGRRGDPTQLEKKEKSGGESIWFVEWIVP